MPALPPAKVRVTLRYANILGPRDTVGGEHAITVFARRLYDGAPPVIHRDGEPAAHELGRQPRVPLKSGLARTLGWFRRHQLEREYPICVKAWQNMVFVRPG